MSTKCSMLTEIHLDTYVNYINYTYVNSIKSGKRMCFCVFGMMWDEVAKGSSASM